MTTAEPPVLRTERLRLDRHWPQDLDDCAAIWADPLTMRHLGGKPQTRSESWARILRHAGCWALLGFGSWAVREAASGRYLGSVGFLDARRDTVPRLDAIPETGWVIAASAWGQGYATEAITAALRWGDAHLGHARTICLIEPENLASLRVAEKVGYRPWQNGRLGETELLIMERIGSNP